MDGISYQQHDCHIFGHSILVICNAVVRFRILRFHVVCLMEFVILHNNLHLHDHKCL